MSCSYLNRSLETTCKSTNYLMYILLIDNEFIALYEVSYYIYLKLSYFMDYIFLTSHRVSRPFSSVMSQCRKINKFVKKQLFKNNTNIDCIKFADFEMRSSVFVTSSFHCPFCFCYNNTIQYNAIQYNTIIYCSSNWNFRN